MEKENTKPTDRDILQRAARKQAGFTAEMENLNGYETITTYYGDFTIAEAFGLDAVRDTYKKAVKDWAHNYKYFTEIVLVLNHKIWEHYQNNEPLARLYDELWREADGIAAEWTGEAAEYYFNVTD